MSTHSAFCSPISIIILTVVYDFGNYENGLREKHKTSSLGLS